MEVVNAADSHGSTEYILKTISEAPAGSKFAVGTEVSLVNRIAAENPDNTVFCLDPLQAFRLGVRTVIDVGSDPLAELQVRVSAALLVEAEEELTHSGGTTAMTHVVPETGQLPLGNATGHDGARRATHGGSRRGR